MANPIQIECPGAAELRDFHLGRLSSDRLDAVADHVAVCEACDGNLRALDTQHDEVMTVLRRPAKSLKVDPDLLPGYTILRELGRGGMGVVYEAIQHGLDRRVAIKRLRDTADGEHERFRTEAEALARLQHPNIVQIFEVGEWPDAIGLHTPFLALELVSGGSLDRFLDHKPMPPLPAARLVIDLARGLAHAHREGIVHRDLKPANILLHSEIDNDGKPLCIDDIAALLGVTPKITDFGIAKRMASDGPTRTGDVLGTPAYMAPEQAAGEDVGASTDIYSVGAILYECLTGRPPFQGMDAVDTLLQVRTLEPISPRKLYPAVPLDLDTICMKCLWKDPTRRYATGDELADDLERFTNNEPIKARPVGVTERCVKWMRRRPSQAILAGTILAFAIVLISGGFYLSARLAESAKVAKANAETAAQQRDVALKTIDRLIFEQQEYLRNHPDARELRTNLLTIALTSINELAATTKDASPDFSRLSAHQRVGELYSQLGQTDKARQQLEEARSIGAKLLRDSNRREIHAATCKALHTLGYVELADNRPEQAEAAFSEFRRAAEAWQARWPNDPEAAVSVRLAYDRIGDSALRKRDLKGAEAAFNAMMALAKPGEAKQSSSLMGRSFVNTGRLDLEKGEPVTALMWFQKAQAIFRQQADDNPSDAVNNRDLMIAYRYEAEGLRALEQIHRAVDVSAQAVAAAKKNVELDSGRLEHQTDLVGEFNQHGLALERAGRFAQAIEQFERAAELIDRLTGANKLQSDNPHSTTTRREIAGRIGHCKDVLIVVADPRRIQGFPPEYAIELMWAKVRALATDGQWAEVLASAQELCNSQPATPPAMVAVAERVAACIPILKEKVGDDACQTAMDRCLARGMELLNSAVERGYVNATVLRTEPRLQPLRDQPGFQAVLFKVQQNSRNEKKP